MFAHKVIVQCADPDSFVREGLNLKSFVLVDEGRVGSSTTIGGSLSARQQNAIYMAFRWSANDGPIMLAW